jgi:hypothetical protein
MLKTLGLALPRLTPLARHAASQSTLLALATVLACLPLPASAQKEGPPVPLDADFQAAQSAKKLVAVSSDDYVKGTQRVAVTQFAVQFVTSDNVTGKTSSFGGGGASATGIYNLVGVSQPEFQAVVNAAHAAFIKDLEAAGFEVVPHAQVAASATWRQLVAGGKPAPVRNDDYVVVAPPGMGLYGMTLAGPATTASGTGAGGLMGALSSFQGVTSAFGQIGESNALQRELGGAALLEVSVRVHFAELTNNNRGFLGRMAASASVSGKVLPSVRQARMSLHKEPAIVSLDVTSPLTLDPAAFSDLRTATSGPSGAEVGAAAVSILGSLVLGRPVGGGAGAVKTFEAVAEPARWREVVGAGVVAANQLFVERLKAGR